MHTAGTMDKIDELCHEDAYRQQILRDIKAAKAQLEKLESEVKEAKTIPMCAEAITTYSPVVANTLEKVQNSVSKQAEQVWHQRLTRLVESASWSTLQTMLDELEQAPDFCKRVLTYRCPIIGSFLLHKLCEGNPPVGALQTMLELTKKDQIQNKGFNYEWTNRSMQRPIHVLMQCGGSFECLQLLLDADSTKESLTVTDRECYTPLLWLVARMWSVDQVEKLYPHLRLLVDIDNKHSRQSLTMTDDSAKYSHSDDENKVPLQILWSKVTEGINECPEKAIYDKSVQFLLKATCVSIDKGDEFRETNIDDVPLLYAVLKCAPYFGSNVVSIVTELLRSSFSSPQALDSQGNTILHLLAQFDIVDGAGFWYMLHRREELCAMRLDLIQCILKHDVGAAKLQNRNGQIPLHVALQHNETAPDRRNERYHICKQLVEAHPESLEVVEEHSSGLYPFSMASVGEDSCLDTAYLLLRKCPWLLMQSTDGNEVNGGGF